MGKFKKYDENIKCFNNYESIINRQNNSISNNNISSVYRINDSINTCISNTIINSTSATTSADASTTTSITTTEVKLHLWTTTTSKICIQWNQEENRFCGRQTSAKTSDRSWYFSFRKQNKQFRPFFIYYLLGSGRRERNQNFWTSPRKNFQAA